MCDYFLQRMEGDQRNHQAGDLTDVVRAGGAMHQQAAIAELTSSSMATGWQFPAEPPAGPGIFPPPQPSSSDGGAGPSGDGFADAFAGLPDPFASDFRASSSSGGGGPGPADFFDFEAPAAVGGARRGVLVDTGGGGVVQMPALSPREIRPYPPVTMMGGDAVKIGVPTMMPGLAVGSACAFDAIAGIQMPSPHGGGIKRRFDTTRDRCQI